jgi:uncharacterized protein
MMLHIICVSNIHYKCDARMLQKITAPFYICVSITFRRVTKVRGVKGIAVLSIKNLLISLLQARLPKTKSNMHYKENGTTDNAISFKKDNLYLAKSELCENGVFSHTAFKQGEIIECCPLIVFAAEDMEFLQYTNLYNYYALKSKSGPPVLALGFGSIYNHNSPSNAQYTVELDKKRLVITSVCSIAANTEITINYNGSFNDDNPVVFVQKNEIYEFSINLL